MRSSIQTKVLLVLAVILAGGMLAAPSARADGPSFDCAKASLPAEKAICADPQLSAIDLLVAKAYKGFEPAFGGDKRKIARGLIADRNACRSDTACIVSALNNALQTYGNAPSWVQDYNIALIGKKALDTAAGNPGNNDQPLPSAVGQCASTHIKTLTTRLGDDPLETASPDAGSAATFTNGGGAVSYDREPGLAASKVGEPVVTCLIAIPRDCPRDDDRGRVYYSIDLVAKGSWALPDSEHLCGGA
ncbi:MULTISPECIES: lysozyme inhibitor LprI family protein [unclassified Mesorhizobium]|uniref:lysozyme inhibitor LprI family protein n=1 Tax=unclassified Mesorhizobium TaxID=325217 RepID=UPI001FE21228|nr:MULTISPECIES: lysozyme inhibitor LprI family protein [unclassified Mesorhizobium]